MLSQTIAIVTDAATGYQIEVTRRDNDDYSVSYVYRVLSPAGADDPDRLIETKESIRLQSNGCGSMALVGG